MHSCCIPPNTGGEYVYFKIYQVLKQRFDVTNFSTSVFLNRFHNISWIAVRYAIVPFFIFYPMFVKGAYDLIFTSWSCDLPFFGDVKIISNKPAKSVNNCLQQTVPKITLCLSGHKISKAQSVYR
jgi:hypothetical protein